ncbi:hypothetical protein [Quadrisphaera sp. KR29]|uniref:hypothetical protein n=1 Tax=Quadrisphaera sp. KR29 TaxID=3461391 RepID=UPI0040447D5B
MPVPGGHRTDVQSAAPRHARHRAQRAASARRRAVLPVVLAVAAAAVVAALLLRPAGGAGSPQTGATAATGAPGGAAAPEPAATSSAAPPGRPVVPLSAGDGPSTPAQQSAPGATATAADPAALAELARNPRLDFSPRAREALRSQPVDLRVAALLVQLAAQQPLSVADLPATAGGAEPVRTVLLDGLGGSAVGADPDALVLLERQLSAQDPPYRATAERQREGPAEVLRLVLPPAGP